MKPWLKKTLVGGAVAAVLLATIGAVSAHRHGGWHPRSEAEITQMKEHFVERAAGHLKLDAQQKQRLAVLADQLQAQRKALRGATDPKTELRSLVAGPAFDRAKALALLQEKTTTVQAGGPGVITALADFYDGLNPDQQQQLRDMMDRRHGR